METMKKFQIDEKLLQALIQYLASKPYVEVFQMIPALQNLEEVKLQHG